MARLTKTQTDLGRDLDSLADVITFGAAPALMVYKWGLTSFGRLGILIAGLFVCAGALRLARFNTLSRREEAGGAKGPGKYILGLSIPTAASVLVFMVIVSHNAGQYQLVSESSTAVIVLVLSVLMVSRVRFRSFKDLRLSGKTVGVVLLLAGACTAIVFAGLKKAFIFLFLSVAYITLGLAEEIIFFRSRRQAARDAARETSRRRRPRRRRRARKRCCASWGPSTRPRARARRGRRLRAPGWTPACARRRPPRRRCRRPRARIGASTSGTCASGRSGGRPGPR